MNSLKRKDIQAELDRLYMRLAQGYSNERESINGSILTCKKFLEMLK